MASYQARQRDPLLDQQTAAILERRSKELFGLGLAVAGGLAVLMLASYSSEDPSWMAANSAPVNNILGRIGAMIAAPLIGILGLGAWMVPLALLVWGARFITHRGEERASARTVFLPVAVLVAAVHGALLEPSADWSAAYGMGGRLGDMVAGSLLGIAPVGGSTGLKLFAFLFMGATISAALFVLGFTKSELRALWARAQFLMVSGYAMGLGLAGRGAQASVIAARSAQERARQRRAEAQERAAELAAWQAQQDAWERSQTQTNWAAQYAEPEAESYAPEYEADYGPEYEDQYEPQQAGLMTRIKRAVIEQDWAEPQPVYAQDYAETYAEPYAEELQEAYFEPELVEAPSVSEDRIRARIASAVHRREPQVEAQPETPRSKVSAAVANRLARVEPVLRAQPKAEVFKPEPLKAELRAEPVLKAALKPAVTPRFMPPKPAFLSADPLPQPVASKIEWVEEEALWEPELTATEALALADTLGPNFVPDYAAAFEDRDFSDPYADDYTPNFEPAYAPAPQSLARAAQPVFETKRAEKPLVQHAMKRPTPPSKQAIKEAQPALRFETQHPAYETPPLSLLMNPATIQRHQLSDEALEENARMLETVLDDYGVKGEIVSVRPGPVVTMYELEPAPGLKASRVIGLADDIARSMSALSARVSTVPGRSVIGIELPNEHREKVALREILSARDFGDSNMRLPLALGKDIAGEPIVANLAKMPHLLIAGTTGSGKSVAINTMILSLLYKLSPDECRLIMIDPKMLELSVYDGIPHLLSPVVTDPKKAVVALKWVVGEMEERYRKMSKMGVRNIEGYNSRVRDAMAKGEMFKRTVQTGFDEETGEPIFETDEFQPTPIPYIVVIVDEMADLMMVAGKEIEACIQRLAQMARASGIHLIMATQRPSVDVITGTIKANFPTRISFQVTSKIDSRTILGEQGAEQLLGMGDMLYMGNGARITRIHGPFVSDEEVEEIVNHLKSFGPPAYMSGVVDGPDEESASDIDAVLGLGGGEGEDALYDQAVAIVAKDRKCSTSYIQRKLGIGYNKAARLVEQMEEQQVVSTANHVGKREVLVPEM